MKRLCPMCNSKTTTARHFNAKIVCPKCEYVLREEGEIVGFSCTTEDQLARRKAIFNEIHINPLDEKLFMNPKSRELNMQLNAFVVYYLRKLEAIRKLEDAHKELEEDGSVPG